MNLAAAAGILMIRAYRVLVASWMPSVCRFQPSCSRYAEEAIRRYGPLRGAARAAGRLARCHPFHPGGLDPLT